MKNLNINKRDKEFIAHYIKTFSDTAREPFLVLDSKLRITGANKSFYKSFQATKEQLENKFLYDIGDHQWDIPELRNLLEKILPQRTVFNDFEVAGTFPKIGPKIMLLNARRLDETKQILLAFEDVTLKRAIETKLANYTENLKKGITEKTAELKARIDELAKLNKLMLGRELKMAGLKKEISQLKKEIKKKDEAGKSF